MEEDLYKTGLSQKLVLKQLKRPGQMGASLGDAPTWELQDDAVLGSKVEASSYCQWGPHKGESQQTQGV